MAVKVHSGTMKGHVNRVIDGHYFGYLRGLSGLPPDYCFRRNDLDESLTFGPGLVGREVRFEFTWTPKGYHARNVRPA